MVNIECKIAILNDEIRNPKCTYFPVVTGKERCWHYIEKPGKQSDAPPCPRLLRRQHTMPK